MEVSNISSDYQSMLESCQHSSVMLLTLINDLLDLAKQQKFTFQFNLSFFDLVAASNNSFKTLEFLAKTKSIQTEVVSNGEPALLQRIFGDENRFE